MRSATQYQFSQVPQADIPRSSFNRSHGYKTTFDAGYLVPVFVDEALPGDTFNVKMSAFARMATPIAPLMDNLYLDTFFFAVPIRLVWSNFKKFMGEQTNPGDSTSYTIPTMAATASTGYAIGSLHDYIGLPTGIPDFTHSCLWHRAYNLIWNEWFRDQNLQNSVTVDTGDSASSPTNYVLLKRGKRHDYFTSCLPWPQKGTAVSVPLGTSAPVKGNGQAIQMSNVNDTTKRDLYTVSGSATVGLSTTPSASGAAYYAADATTGLYADLNSATAATINSLRQAFQIQKLYERDARGGTRYTEIVRSHFGVISPDARLQRPEYLGGGTSSVNIHPIPQTSSTDGTSPQGNLAGFGTVAASGHGFVKSFTEHTLLLGLACVRSDLNYQQGLNKMFSRSTRWDFYWPALSHLGEQTVLNQEIYLVDPAGAGAAQNAAAFGYQERYAEYRYKPSQITGKFRSTASGTLDLWHLADKYTSLPALNSTFIQVSPPMTRVKAVNTQPDFLFDAYFDMKCARPMPTYSVPGLIDHF